MNILKKYSTVNFGSFLGNERAKEYISAAFEKNAVPHALLITGEEGTEKALLAEIIARSLVCKGGDTLPCEVCSSCKKSKNKAHPDISFIDISKIDKKTDYIRDLKKDALLRPNDADRKVYIISEAGAMTHPAQDALLKILEEPPLFTFFILICYNQNELLGTVLSRCSHIPLTPVGQDFSARDEGIVSSAEEIARALVSHNELSIFKSVTALEKSERNELSAIFRELILLLRDAVFLASSVSAAPLSALSGELSKRLSEEFLVSDCLKLSDGFSRALDALSANIGTSHITASLACHLSEVAVMA